ncbi:MAG: ribonuclease [Clostridiales bacterium]|nr:ribonuclease [Clostridiales bacterium]
MVVESLPEKGQEETPEASEAPETAESEAPAASAEPVGEEPEAPAEEPLAEEPAAQEVPAATEAPQESGAPAVTAAPTPEATVEYGYDYSDPYDVADYIHLYGELPPNFITKDEAKEWGWVSSEGNLWEVAPGMSIGGDRFGNREKLLPEASGRKWYECDVNYEGGFRGAERILYSNDGLIYYTDDHYESFTAIYG